MPRRKRKLTAAEKAAKKRRRKEYMTVFINGKQKRVKRPPTIDGMSVDEFIEKNADPIWLHQNEMWELIKEEPIEEEPTPESPSGNTEEEVQLDEIPF